MKSLCFTFLSILVITSCNYSTNFQTSEEKKDFYFPDSTLITLNEFSKVKYKKSFKKRKIEVQGEAYIEILDTEAPFSIQCEQLLLELRGEQFYIKTDDEKVLFIPIDGRARAELIGVGGQNIITIKEYNQLEFDLSENIMQVSDVEDKNFMSWYYDALFYNNQPLKKVLANLEQHFEVQLKVSSYALENCIINDTFPKPNINNILPELASQIACKLEKTEKSYIFIGEGCEEELND